MYGFDALDDKSNEEFYEQLMLYAKGLVDGEKDFIANLANVSALLFQLMTRINWAGFYLYKDEELVLGPFQGKPACIRIAIGKGVCGTAAATRQPQLVGDVQAFKGHIACDGDTQSELVIPMIKEGKLIGVLDLDSPFLERFNLVDQAYMLELVTLVLNQSDCL